MEKWENRFEKTECNLYFSDCKSISGNKIKITPHMKTEFVEIKTPDGEFYYFNSDELINCLMQSSKITTGILCVYEKPVEVINADFKPKTKRKRKVIKKTI
jgi:hypothetical protein